MSTTGTEKHCRLCLMLNKGGTKACHSLLLNRVKELTPSNNQPHPWSVDAFLKSKKKEILKSNISKEKSQVLFPRTGVTDVSKWDLSLFCHILMSFCELKQITRLDVKQLRTVRNELCHMNEPSIDEMKYQDYLNTIKVVVVRILDEINDSETKEATEKILDDIHHGPLSLVETLKEMHTFYSMETDIREKFEYIKEAEDRVLQKVEQFDEKLEQIITILYPEASSKLHSARNNCHLPVVEMNLDLKNLSQDEEQRMSTALEQLFEEVINEDEDFKSTIPTESYTRLRKAVRKTFKIFLSKGWRITSAKHECVQFNIRCSSFASLAALFREHIQGEINNELTDLKEAISEALGGKEAQLETVIYKDVFWSVMDKTVSAVDDFLNEDYGQQCFNEECANALDICSRLLETELRAEFNASHVSVIPKMPEKAKVSAVDDFLNEDSNMTTYRRLPLCAEEKKHSLTITARNDGPQSFNEEGANALEISSRLLEIPKMPEKAKDKAEPTKKKKCIATPTEEKIRKDYVVFPSSSGSLSSDERYVSHELHSEASNMDQETISKEYEVINRAFKTGDIRQLKHYFELEKDNWKNKPWNIAVTGNYGVGKSSFINAIRNAETGEDLWAEKYVVDITEKPTPYQHPECPNLVFGDMPPTFPQERYLKQVDFRKYDIFLILFSDRLTENYQWLAEEVKKEGKRVFFVRTKIDWDVTNMKRASKIKTNKSDFVEKVRKECINNIKERGLYSDVEETLFMIDNMNPKTFDFEKLETKLIEYFQKEKREGIALSVTNMTEGFIKAKKDVLQKTVYLQAMTSAAAAAVPIPGFDVPVDIAILLRAARDYKEQFGVDEKTVENIARSLGTTVDSLKIKLDLKSLGISTSNKGIKMLCASIAISKGTENAVKFAVPIIGSFIAAGVSYGVCVGCLTSLLNAISDDALKLNREIVRMISNSGTVAEAFE